MAASSPGTLGAPTAPASVTPAHYQSCSAPCMTVMALSGNPDNTNSSPYADATSGNKLHWVDTSLPSRQARRG